MDSEKLIQFLVSDEVNEKSHVTPALAEAFDNWFGAFVKVVTFMEYNRQDPAYQKTVETWKRLQDVFSDKFDETVKAGNLTNSDCILAELMRDITHVYGEYIETIVEAQISDMIGGKPTVGKYYRGKRTVTANLTKVDSAAMLAITRLLKEADNGQN